MTAFRRDVPRRMIPRWHSLAAAQRQGELASLTPRASAFREQLSAELGRKEREWLSSRKLSAAAELVGSSALLGASEHTAEAATALLTAEHTPLLARQAAIRFLGVENEQGEVAPSAETAAVGLEPGTHRQDAITQIASHKQALIRDPRQALAWAELARLYEALNQRRQARAAMDVALRLAPHNRFLLRSAARLAVRHDDPEEGHAMLARAPRTRSDPWLVSAEIAMASLADRRSPLIRHGERMLSSDKFSPGDTAELASALGTEEMSGRSRQARRLFEKSLEDPTENVVAQVGWASQHLGGLSLQPKHLETPDSYEARALQYAEQGDWRSAVDNSWLWLAALPFSGAPGIFGSFHASVGGDFEQGAALARAALLANPDEFLLHNNLAYCLLQLDLLDSADPHLAEMETLRGGELEQAVLLATRGLRAFRAGDHNEGRRLYQEAIEMSSDPGMRTTAMLALAREEVLASTALANESVAAAVAVADTMRDTAHVRRASIALMVDQLLEAVQHPVANR